MEYTFSELKSIALVINTENNKDYNFGLVSSAAKTYISKKLPLYTYRNAKKTSTVSKAKGLGAVARFAYSTASKNPSLKFILDTVTNSQYETLVRKIREEGKARGLKGPALKAYVRRQLKSANLRRFG